MTERGMGSFSELITPISPNEFFKTYFEQSHLHISRTDNLNPYSNLFSLNDLDHCIGKMVNHNLIRVVKSEDNKPTHYPIAQNTQTPLSIFYDAFYEQNTIIVNSMHLHWDPASNLAYELTRDLGYRININMYVTPPGATGFPCHWDSHDVLILQIEGQKHWKFFIGGPDLPNERTGIDRKMSDNPGTPSNELVMNPGDFLYIPRGTIHGASSIGNTSIHWTIGLYPNSMEDLLRAALQGWAKNNRELRKSLPPGYMNQESHMPKLENKLRDLLKTAATEIHFKTSLNELSNPWDSTRSFGDGHFEQLILIERMTLDSVVTKRFGDHFQLTCGLKTCLLTAPGFKYQPPGRTFQSLDYMCKHSTFTTREIIGWLNDEENLLLVRHLVRQGFLRIVTV